MFKRQIISTSFFLEKHNKYDKGLTLENSNLQNLFLSYVDDDTDRIMVNHIARDCLENRQWFDRNLLRITGEDIKEMIDIEDVKDQNILAQSLAGKLFSTFSNVTPPKEFEYTESGVDVHFNYSRNKLFVYIPEKRGYKRAVYFDIPRNTIDIKEVYDGTLGSPVFYRHAIRALSFLDMFSERNRELFKPYILKMTLAQYDHYAGFFTFKRDRDDLKDVNKELEKIVERQGISS